MYDRIPSPGKENRVSITQDNGQVITGVLAYADDATQEGSAYTKGNVLPDDVCGILGIDPDTSEPKDAWIGVIQAVGYSLLTITVQDIDGSPAAGVQVSGLTDVLEEKTYTDSNGKIFLILKEGSYTLSVPKFEGCIDATMTPIPVSLGAGDNKTVLLKPVSNGVKSLSRSTSDTIKFSSNVTAVDVCVVGAGGGGGGGMWGSGSFTGSKPGGGGGGGGRVANALGIVPTPYQEYQLTVGSGGLGGDGGTQQPISIVDYGSSGDSGGFSSFMGVSASGGSGGGGGSGRESDGGSGGSGGGGGSAIADGGTGGTDGADGESGNVGSGGSGQGTTTRAFGEPGGTLYSTGGDGGRTGSSGSDGNAPGCGGGGGYGREGASDARDGYPGQNGIVLARWTTKT